MSEQIRMATQRTSRRSVDMIKQRPARLGIQDNNTCEGESETDLRTDDCGEATHMSLDY